MNVINQDNMVVADIPTEHELFKELICDDCRTQHEGDCIKDNTLCPVEWGAAAYKRGA